MSLVLVPHKMISFEWRISIGSRHLVVPLVIFTPGADGGAADRPLHAGRAEPVPESLGEAHRQQALVAGIAVRHDRLGAVAIDDLVES